MVPCLKGDQIIMKRAVLTLILMLSMPLAAVAYETPACRDSDRACKTFRTLSEEEKYEMIVQKAGPAEKYSPETQYYIGQAYLQLAGRETNTPDQEEQFCRKALEYGQHQAYMGLYFINAQKDPEAALEYLRLYSLTSPADSVPFVLLGESELDKGNYAAADIFLREAKRVARAQSPRVDWMLFQANYMMENYTFAGEMFGRALENAKFRKEVKRLLSDKNFKGIEKRPEFRKYRAVFSESKLNS